MRKVGNLYRKNVFLKCLTYEHTGGYEHRGKIWPERRPESVLCRVRDLDVEVTREGLLSGIQDHPAVCAMLEMLLHIASDRRDQHSVQILAN